MIRRTSALKRFTLVAALASSATVSAQPHPPSPQGAHHPEHEHPGGPASPEHPDGSPPGVPQQVLQSDAPMPVPPPPPPAPPPPPFRVAVSYDVNGQFTSLTCSDRPSTLTSVAGEFAGEPGVLAMDSGDILGSAAVTRLTEGHDIDGLAVAIQAAGFRVLAVGHRDLSADRAGFIRGVRALTAHGVPHVLSNLHCDAAHHDLCDAITDGDDPPFLIDTPAGRTAIISVMAPSQLGALAPSRAAGLSLDPVGDAVPRLITNARAAGAVHVVVTFDPTDHHEFEDAMALAGTFAPGTGPDAMVVNELPDGVATIETAHGGVPVAATRSGAVVVLQPGEPVFARPAHEGTPPTAVANFVRGTTQWLCDNYRRPLPGGSLTSPMELGAFGGFLLDVLRDTAHAEVGIINHAAVRGPNGLFPIEGGVTELAVAAALPFEDSVQVTSLSGAALKALATSPAAADFYIRGVDVAADGTVTINGRPEDDTQTYRIVTTGFISQGVGHLFGDHPPDFERFGSSSLQENLQSWLAVPRTGDVRTLVSNPSNNVRWHLRWTVDGSFASSDIANPSSAALPTGYTDAQLTRAETSALQIDTEFRADADHPEYQVNNSLRVQYSEVRNIPVGGLSTGLVPTTDLITERSDLTWRAYHGAVQWYDPQPYAAMFIESEFVPPPTRTFQHFEVRPSVGARFDLLDRLAFNLGIGGDYEFGRYQEPANSPLVTFIAGITLKPGKLFSIGGRVVQAQGLLEAAWANPWINDQSLSSSSVTIRASAKLIVPLFDPIALTLGYDVFARNQNGTPWGISGDGMVGLRVTLDHSIQTF